MYLEPSPLSLHNREVTRCLGCGAQGRLQGRGWKQGDWQELTAVIQGRSDGVNRDTGCGGDGRSWDLDTGGR